MLPLLGRPLVEWVIDELHKAGASAVSIAANGNLEQLRGGLENALIPDEVRISFVRETVPRGPAGSVRSAYDFEKGGAILAIEGGLFVAGGLDDLVETHRHTGAALTMAILENSGKHIPGGVYVFSPQAVELIPEVGYVDIKEQLIPRLIRLGLGVRGHVFSGYLHKVFRAVDHLRLIQKLLCGELGPFRDGPAGPGAGQPVIAESAVVEPGASVVGPVFVDRGALIRNGAKVIGPALIGKNCLVECDAVVCESLMEEGSAVEPGVKVIGKLVRSGPRRGPWRRLRDWLGGGASEPGAEDSTQQDIREPLMGRDTEAAE